MTDASLLGAAPTPDSLEGRTIRARLIRRLAPEAADAPTTLGRFELGRLLGQGSFGSVYEAHDPQLGRTVALKVLRPLPNLAARLVEEARTMAAVSHPNVVEIYGADEEDGRAYIVMECIQGRPLDEWLRAETPALPDILAVFRQAAEGLGAAHAQGVLHGDVKPRNVMVGDDGRVRVVDFGLAVALTDISTNAPRTSESSDRLAGTPAYLAPEVVAGQPPRAAADQFSLCVALWEALDGGRLFGERTPATALGDGDELPRPRKTPRWLWRTLRRGLDPRPRRRFASASTLARALTPPRRTPAFVLGGAAVSASLVAATWSQPATCVETVDARLNRTWPTADRVAFREAMAQAREATAAADDMDAYVERWVSASVELCQASRNERALSPTRDAVACSTDRLEAAVALTRELARPGFDATRIAQAMRSLPDVDGCTAVTTGLIPLDLQLAGDVDAIRRQLAQVHARTVAGRGHAAMALLDRVRVRVDEIGLPWLSSRAALAEAQLLQELGRYDDAVAVMRRSFMVEHGDPALTVRTGLGLIMVFGTRLLDTDAALQWSRHVEAAMARLDAPDPSLEQRWLRMTGVSLMVAGRYDEALQWLERAVDLARVRSGDERDRAGAESNLGSLLMRMDRPADALEHFDAALELALNNARPGDALIADSLLNRGTALETLGRHEEARQTTERALALHIEHRGADHPSVAGVRQSLGTTLLNLGRTDDAIEQFVAAEAVSVAVLGPDHPDVAFAATSLAGALITAGQPAAAREAAMRAVSITEAAQGPEHPMMVYRLLAAAEAAHHDDDHNAAVQLAQRADGLATKVYPAQHEVRVAAAEMLASLRGSASADAPPP